MTFCMSVAALAFTCCTGSPCELELVKAPNTSVTPLLKEMVDIFMSLCTLSGNTLAASLTKPWANWQELENIWLSCCTFPWMGRQWPCRGSVPGSS